MRKIQEIKCLKKEIAIATQRENQTEHCLDILSVAICTFVNQLCVSLSDGITENALVKKKASEINFLDPKIFCVWHGDDERLNEINWETESLI